MKSYLPKLLGLYFFTLLSTKAVAANQHQKRFRGVISSVAHALDTMIDKVNNKQSDTLISSKTDTGSVPSSAEMTTTTGDSSKEPEDIPVAEVVWGKSRPEDSIPINQPTGPPTLPPFNPCPIKLCPYNCGYGDEGECACFCGVCPSN